MESRSPHVLQDVPPLFEHLDALLVFVMDPAVVVTLVHEPQQLEVNGVEQSLLDVRFVESIGAKDDLTRLKTGEIRRANAFECRHRIPGYSTTYYQFQVPRLAELSDL